jgi:hypothetical protein
MIAAELAQRRFVQLKKNFAQLLGRGITGSKTLSVNLTQGADEGVAVLVAYFAVVVAVAIVETGFAHGALHYADRRKHPPVGPNGNRAPQPPPPDKGGEGAGLQAAKRVEITFLENDFL